jgi:hypothetical protein
MTRTEPVRTLFTPRWPTLKQQKLAPSDRAGCDQEFGHKSQKTTPETMLPRPFCLVAGGGFEPPTSGLWSKPIALPARPSLSLAPALASADAAAPSRPVSPCPACCGVSWSRPRSRPWATHWSNRRPRSTTSSARMPSAARTPAARSLASWALTSGLKLVWRSGARRLLMPRIGPERRIDSGRCGFAGSSGQGS